ncbi:MAG: hypothetical protein QOI57_3058 [Rubrobacteraceae bacterium]|jgi:hypothetical protein|nr:hypothetical protein [Rubrobacteraceae bacterium]
MIVLLIPMCYILPVKASEIVGALEDARTV